MALSNEDLQAIALLLNPIQQSIISLESKMTSLESETALLSSKVTSIEMTLENETNRNIKIIAEGHLDLSRKLDNALKTDNEKEMLLIRINILENEIRKIKEKLEIA